MSAGVIQGTTTTAELPEDDTILELTGGENPLEFLGMNKTTILALISGMKEFDRIDGWWQAETEFVDSDRTVVLEALARQWACLERGDIPPIYHPGQQGYDPADDPLVVDDSGYTVDRGQEKARHDTHPEANLEAGEVLVVDRDDSTEYIWPARADAAEPYILREFVDGDQRQELTISPSDAYERLNFDPEKTRTDAVDVQAPLEAVVNGGEQA